LNSDFTASCPPPQVLPRSAAPIAYTYMSVKDPRALNLDGSIYGIAVCLSKVSKDNWVRRRAGAAPVFRGGAVLPRRAL